MRYLLILLFLIPVRAIAADESCVTLDRVTAAITSYDFWIAPASQTVTAVGCYCQGTCSTAATFSFTDRAGNAMGLSGGGNLVCQTGSSDTTFTAIISGGALVTGEGLRLSVANTPTSVDRVTVCTKF